MAFFCRRIAKQCNWAVRIAVTVLVVYVVNRSVSTRQMEEILHKLSWWNIAASVLLGLAGVVLHATRWRLALASQGTAISPKEALRTYLWGVALGLITPARVGEFVRGAGLAQTRFTTTTLAVAIEKLYLVGAALTFGTVGWVGQQFMGRGIDSLLQWVGVTWPIFLLIGWYAMVQFQPLRSLPASFAVISRVGYALREAHERMGKAIIFYALAAQFTLVIQTSLLLWQLGGGEFWGAMCASCQAYALMLFIPISIGNMGIREFALRVYFFERMPVSFVGSGEASCLGVSLIIFCVNIVAPAAAGLVWTLGFGNSPAVRASARERRLLSGGDKHSQTII